MAEAKREYVKFITPRGVAKYPRLNKPDSGPKGKESKVPKYSVKLEFNPEGASVIQGKTTVSIADIIVKLEALRDAEFDKIEADLKAKKKGALVKKMHKVPVFTPVLDENGDETGLLYLTPKTASEYKDKKTGEMVKKPRPTVFDAKGKVIAKLPAVGGGSEMKIAVSAAPYFVDSSGAVGVTYYLEGVQLLKLVEFGARSAESLGFGNEDGYDASEGAGSFDDEAGDDKDDTKSTGSAADDSDF